MINAGTVHEAALAKWLHDGPLREELHLLNKDFGDHARFGCEWFIGAG